MSAAEEKAASLQNNGEEAIIIIMESQRFHWSLGWNDHQSRHAEDPRRFARLAHPASLDTASYLRDVALSGGGGDEHFDAVAPEVGGGSAADISQRWSVWKPGKPLGRRDDGWQYNTGYSRNERKWTSAPGKSMFVRRRFWKRYVDPGAVRFSLGHQSSFSGMEQQAADSRKALHGALRCGWMSMRKGLSKQLTKRYFVLYPRVLVYYDEEPPTYDIMQCEPNGIVPLKGATVRDTRKPPPDVPPPSTNAAEDAAAAAAAGEESFTTVDVPLIDAPPSSDEQTFAIDSPTAERSILLRCDTKRRENGEALADVAGWEAEAVAAAKAWMQAIDLAIMRQYGAALRVGEVRTRLDARMVSAMAEQAVKEGYDSDEGFVKSCDLCALS